MSVETVSHHGRTTAYRVDDGPSPTVLFVHGSGGERGLWRGQRRLDAATVAVDLSGHGDSDDIDADAGYETLSAYTDDVVAVLEATETTVLVGHSLGGAVALWTALERDVDLDGLVLTGTGPRLPVLADLLEWLATDFERAVAFLQGPDRLFHNPDSELQAASTRLLYDTGQAVTHRDFRTANAFNVLGRVDEIELPAAAVVGEFDQFTPFRYHEYLADELSNCSLIRIRNAAHFVMLEQPKAFNAIVSGVLDRVA